MCVKERKKDMSEEKKRKREREGKKQAESF